MPAFERDYMYEKTNKGIRGKHAVQEGKTPYLQSNVEPMQGEKPDSQTTNNHRLLIINMYM